MSENKPQETAQFLSEAAPVVNEMITTVPRQLTSDQVDGMYLKDFLSRPVNIYTFSWTETLPPGSVSNIQPWKLFFSDSRIANKLANFAFLQCTLKLKFVINASPFYYGAMLINYQPLHTLTPSTIATGIGVDDETMLRSQRPHLWLYPQLNKGGEMTLPYLNFRYWTRTIVQQEFIDLGLLSFSNVTSLQSSNGTSGTGVSIGVFAWAEDVTITGPTLGTTMAQGGDEYGVVSTPSSYIATAASVLKNVPIIGPFARATEIGARAISSIASLFGFTNVPNLKDVEPINIKPFHNFADTSISFPIDKLTLDSKNELSVSQAIAGLPDIDDPLTISSFCERESYLCQVPFSTTNSPNDALFYLNISPVMCNSTVINANDTAIASTPMSYCAALFQQWRGDIIIRVTVVASRFHKGRVRLIYDPLGDSTSNIVTATNSYSGCVNQILDISEDATVEMTIPYSQATPFLNIDQYGVVQHQIGTAPSFNRDFNKHNGAFMIRCVTKLTAPVASSEIQLLVSVRSKSVEFANPGFYAGESLLYSFAPAQAGFEYDIKGAIVNAGESRENTELYHVVFGERIVSLRQYMKRMNFYWASDYRETTTDYAIQHFRLGRYPMTYGYDTSGLDTATGLITTGSSFNFNWTPLSPLTWISTCFIGQRGSINYAVNSASYDGKQRAEVYVARKPTISVINNIREAIASAGVSYTRYAKQIAEYYVSAAGTAITTGFTNLGFEFQMPMLSQLKFQRTSYYQGVSRTTMDGSDHDCFDVLIRSAATQYQSPVHFYVGAGTDYNCIFFINVPSVHNYSAVPQPGN
jgi:hypothetical protein